MSAPSPLDDRRTTSVVDEVRPEPVERATRATDGAWLGGVCKGIADHLDWSVGLVRGAFFGLAMAQFIGVIAYAVLWMMMPQRSRQVLSPGLEAASRSGMRDVSGQDVGSRRLGGDRGAVAALALFAGGAAFLGQSSVLGRGGTWVFPLVFAACGVALIWRQADERPTLEEPSSRWLRPFLARNGWPAITRLVLGFGLVAVAVSMVAAGQLGIAELPRVLALSGLMVFGLVIAAAPWIHRLRVSLRQAHEDKLLDQARADMAAHLHDSVLQTLALIQRQADDPRAVATLARRQERELRTWLYGEQPTDASLSVALSRAAQEIEDDTAVPVEVVCVGDAEITPGLGALVRAAREAMMNAAKHSGAGRIDVFAEVEDGHVEVFVRDRGKGFDLDAVADDRMGVRGSIIGRMERHGGSARIRSTPGEGTEIRLDMTL